MDIFNKIITGLFRLFFYPLKYVNDFWGLLIVSTLTGLLMLIVFKKVSNQAGILSTKNHIKAHLLGIRLYKHDAVLSLGTMGRIFLENGRYFMLALKPMLILMLPVIVLIIQLSARYGYTPAEVGKPIIVTVQVNDAVNVEKVRVTASQGIRVEMPPLHIPSSNEINWRMTPAESGVEVLTFQYEDQKETKKIVVNKKNLLFSPRRVSSLAALLYPVEKTIDDESFLRDISIGYSENKISFAGWRIQWLVFFFVVSLATGFLAKGIIHVHL